MQAVSAETAENVTEATQDIRIVDILPLNSTTVEVIFSNQQRLTLDFYGNHIFRLFQDPMGGILRDPVAEPEAKILVDQPRRAVGPLKIGREANRLSVETDRVRVTFDKHSTLMSVTDLRTGRVVLEEAAPVAFDKKQVAVTLKEQPQEYFYGGGVQNGRFSHKGRVIAIENQNSWTDGGVASPNPFYWSTAGYGILWHTFAQGEYDFGRKQQGLVTLSHQTDYLDLFVLVNERPVDLLNDYYQLTGHPVLLPKFGFYEGHLNAYNRDYWKEDTTGILFEDGKRYRESQKDNGGVKESLNGEKQNYQFSARAVIDRYKAHDMPLGWLLPNDGYGAGYGQTGTLDGNIQNLRNLTDYAHENGVEIGLWTQSDLHPKEGVEPLLQRDIVKEVRDAGVRVLKTDVAWVGAGYSFGLNGITDVAQIIMPVPSSSVWTAGPVRNAMPASGPATRRAATGSISASISPPTLVPACREIPTSRRTWTASSGARISWSTRAISCGRPSRPCNSTWTAGGPMRSIPMPWANLLLPAGRECLLLRGSSQLEPFCHTGHALCGEGHHQEPATAYEAGQERHHGCCHGGSHRGVCL